MTWRCERLAVSALVFGLGCAPTVADPEPAPTDTDSLATEPTDEPPADSGDTAPTEVDPCFADPPTVHLEPDQAVQLEVEHDGVDYRLRLHACHVDLFLHITATMTDDLGVERSAGDWHVAGTPAGECCHDSGDLGLYVGEWSPADLGTAIEITATAVDTADRGATATLGLDLHPPSPTTAR